ncbi:hypothetical protein R3P38DRAFT_3175583 [Favolaschia claudopus]|uniref:Uncharacterized protein n=1 Tax=Favolaschia claudopus TaxID=2862362 RepID=A0AAW0D434_9AGAR
MNNEGDAPMDEPYTAPPRLKVPLSANAEGPSKKKAVAGPEQQALDEARNNEQYHRDNASAHRARSRAAYQDTRAAQQDNDLLRAHLLAAQKALQDRQAEVQQLHAQIAEARTHMEKMNSEEGDLHDQIIYDQQQLSELIEQVRAAQNQAVEASTQTYNLQQAINARDAELGQLRTQVHKQDDEVLQLRLQLKAAVRDKPKPTPRRRGRVSNELFGTGKPATLNLPLDPAPLPADSPNPLPSDSQPAELSGLMDHPVVKRVAAKLNMDDEDMSDMLGLLTLTQKTNAQVAVTPTKRKAPKPRKALKKAVQPKTKELINIAHALMRQTTYRLFKVEQSNDFIFHIPATEKEVEDFAADDTATLEHWQWDFGAGYLNTAWNVVQMERLVKAAVAEDEEGRRYVSKGEIQEEFLEFVVREQLERYRADWKLFQPRWDTNANRLETKQEAVARGKVMLYIRRMAAKTLNAQQRKYMHRRTTVEAVIALKEAENDGDLATWIRLLKLLDYLQAAGMSEEEQVSKAIQGQKVKAFKIKLCVWREESISKYLNIVDIQTRRFEELSNGTKSAPRERSQEKGSRPAPKNLPRCLYDSAWLASQTPKQLKELEVSEEVFALFVAATDRMVV